MAPNSVSIAMADSVHAIATGVSNGDIPVGSNGFVIAVNGAIRLAIDSPRCESHCA